MINLIDLKEQVAKAVKRNVIFVTFTFNCQHVSMGEQLWFYF